MYINNVERSKLRSNSSTKYYSKKKPNNSKETRTYYNCNKPRYLVKNYY
jgi:hypothetical protein